MTEIEKKELVEFLLSLSSDYRSPWTEVPEKLPATNPPLNTSR
jgi:hypothetical protein